MKRISFLYTHPIQYFTPLHKQIQAETEIQSTVLYCEDTSAGYFDKQFGQKLKWDTSLTEGYNFIVLRNSFFSRLGGFFKQSNISVWRHLNKRDCDILMVHGWGYFTAIFAILSANIRGVKVWLRAESPLIHEKSRSHTALFIRKLIFKYGLFPLIDKFLYIGEQNRKFYVYYGVDETQLVFTPYSVNNKFFSSEALRLSNEKSSNRIKELIPEMSQVILFSGKLIPKKRPLDLLKAFALLPSKLNAYLLFVGDGELRGEMEHFIQANNLSNVRITGFVNQSKIPIFYSVSDIFVMCSEIGETWGLSTNEAMNFGLPLLISDLTGNFPDLVKENGYVFKTGNIPDLKEKLIQLLTLTETEREKFQENSKVLIGKYSYDTIIDSINKVIAVEE